MKMKPLATAILLSLGTAAHAYQIEVNAGATQADPDADVRNTYGFSVDGIYHLSRVNVGSDPLAEAAFLNRSSNISVLVDHTVQGDDAQGESAFKTYTQQIGVEYYVPNNMLYFAASLANNRQAGDDEQDVGIRVGLTPIQGLLLTVGWQDNQHNDSDSFGLDAKYVTMLGDYFVNFEAGYEKHDVDADDDETISLGVDFYIDTSWSIGLAYADDLGDERTSLRTRKFFEDNIAAGLSYTSGDVADTIAIDFTMRF